MKPLIGLPAQSYEVVSWRPRVQGQRQSYGAAVTAAGGVPVIIPLLSQESDLRQLYNRLDGILLCGGEDVSPQWYGRGAPYERVDPLHDLVELRLARWAMTDGKPVLGICRGLQILNVASGGTLVADLPTDHPGPVNHQACQVSSNMAQLSHELILNTDSRLADILGTSWTIVNSQHHQAVDRLGQGWHAVGYAEDGVIEVIERDQPLGFAVGVQHHPEALIDDARWLRLFQQFVRAAQPAAIH